MEATDPPPSRFTQADRSHPSSRGATAPYNAAMRACNEAEMWQVALQLLDAMPDQEAATLPNPDPQLSKTAAVESGLLSLFCPCLRFLSSHVSFRPFLGDHPPPASTHPPTAFAFHGGRKTRPPPRDASLAARPREVLPDAISFRGAIGACGTGAQWPAALRLLREMAARFGARGRFAVWGRGGIFFVVVEGKEKARRETFSWVALKTPCLKIEGPPFEFFIFWDANRKGIA